MATNDSRESWQTSIPENLRKGDLKTAIQTLDEQLRTNPGFSKAWPPLLKQWMQDSTIDPYTWISFADFIAAHVSSPNPLHFLAQSFIAADNIAPAITLYKHARALGIPASQIDQILVKSCSLCSDTAPVVRWLEDRIDERVREDRTELLHQAARFFLSTGRVMRAIHALEDLEKMDGPSTETSFNLANAYDLIGKHEKALHHIEHVLEQGFEGPQALDRKARILAALRRMDEAVDTMDACLTRHPDFIGGRVQKAIWLERMNRLEEADQSAADVLDRAPDSIEMAVLRLRIARRMKQDPEQLLERTRALTKSPAFRKAGPQIRLHGYFELAEQCDKAGLYEEAWRAYTDGNLAASIAPAAKLIDKEKYNQQIQAKSDWLDRLSPKQLPPKTGDSPFIFFVGFPRSGTTLMEQMLDSHPAIHSLDEKPLLAMLSSYLSGPDELIDMTAERRAELQSIYAEQAGFGAGLKEGEFLLDKLPLNLINLDLIRFIFPGAKIIMALRDPRDCCLSTLAQNFVLNEAMINFTDPVSTAALYDQVMTYYEKAEAILNVDLFRYRYEDLVADRESVLRKMMEFLGLTWDDSLLDHTGTAAGKFISTPSYEKVQKPINQSAVARWKNYWPWLKEPFAPLDKWISRFGYETDKN